MNLLGDLIRVLLLLAIVAVVLACLWYYVALARFMVNELHMNDFGKFYYSARAFLSGTDMYAESPATGIVVGSVELRQFLNLNPPHFHLIILPLALLTPGTALAAWTVVNVMALVASLKWIGTEIGVRWTWSRFAWTCVGVILCSVTGLIITTAQVTFLLMLLVTAAWIALRHDRWDAAGVWLGVAASVKPFLGIYWLLLLCQRQFRAAGIMVGTAALCVTVGLAVFGWEAYLSWGHALAAVDWTWAPMNGSLHGILARTLGHNPLFVPVANEPAAAAVAGFVLSLIAGTISVATITSDQSEHGPDRLIAGGLLTALVISPLGWMYYLWLAAGPILSLSRTSSTRPSWFRDALAVASVPGLLLPLYVATAMRDSVWGSWTTGSIYGWTTLALWAAVILDSRARTVSQNP